MAIIENPFGESRLNSSLDYRPDWDVPSLNEGVVRVLIDEIRKARGRNRPDPAQLIPIMLAAPGYGKTHVFGRVGQQLGDEVLFVFVPGIDDLSRPVEHITRYAVERFFRAEPGKPSPLSRALARLCQPSLVDYLGQFPPSLTARVQGVLQGLRDAPERALEIVSAVKELAPFLRLAESIANSVPAVPHVVIKALALGWSPAAPLVRRWLKGESLPGDDLVRLGLGTETPNPLDVLQGISAILQYQTPLVLCCDQFEIPISGGEAAANEVTARLMSILEKVPNQVVVLSCLESEWDDFQAKAQNAFIQRCRKPFLKLSPLREPQAVELIEKRLKDFPGRPGGVGPVWPFDEPSLRKYVQEKRPTPRTLIQRAAKLLEDWLEGGRENLIRFEATDGGPDDLSRFLALWHRELEKVRGDEACSAEEYPEDRLARAVHKALEIGRDIGEERLGFRIRNIQANAIPQGGTEPRRAFAVEVATRTDSLHVLVPVTTLDYSAKFRFFFDAVREWNSGLADGILLIHRSTDFEMGKTTRTRFDEFIAAGRLRVFALSENVATLERLECLLRFLDRATGGELLLGERSLSPKECQEFFVKTAVLDSLDLFKELVGWRRPAASRPAPVVPKERVGAAVASGVAVSPAPGNAPVVGNGVPPVSPPKVTPVSNGGGWLDEDDDAPAGRGAKGAVKTPATPPPLPPAAAAAAAAKAAAASPAGGLAAFRAKYEEWASKKLAELCKKLTLWGQPVKPGGVEVGPTFARLKVEPAGSKTTFNKIRDKAADISIHLELKVMPMIDKQAGHVSIDVQLPERRTVTLAELLDDPAAAGRAPNTPAFPAGVDIAGRAHWIDLADTSDCHMLVAGQTGSGKSEFLRVLVAALARRLDDSLIQFVLIDPKHVTFNLGRKESPYLYAPVAHEVGDALPLLEWCMDETRRRYTLLAEKKITNVGELDDPRLLPRVVVVVDEFANLLEDKGTRPVLTSLLKQIGAMSRAAGIHLVLATQRPDKDVVTPLLRSNLPGRVALQVQTEADSKLIIREPNARYLLGKGDLLWAHGGGLVRLQSPFITQAELEQALRAV